MQHILPIIDLTRQFAAIERTVRYRQNHYENDAEHSYQLALTCWMVNQQYTLGLRDEHILKYALVHDLVEVYSGDVDPFIDSEEKIQNKHAAEQAAYERLANEYAAYADMIAMIDSYEKKDTAEAQLVYVVDKFVADMNIVSTGDDFYIKNHIRFADWKTWLEQKLGACSLDSRLHAFVKESLEYIEQETRDAFWDESK